MAAVCWTELWLAKAGGRRLCCHSSGESPGRREKLVSGDTKEVGLAAEVDREEVAFILMPPAWVTGRCHIQGDGE